MDLGPIKARLQRTWGGLASEANQDIRDLVDEVERLNKIIAMDNREWAAMEDALALSRAEGRQQGMEEAAKIADEHCCDDCKSSGTLCEEKIAAAIREAAQEKDNNEKKEKV